MAITLPVVEVPGYREQVRKERTIRDEAFLGGDELVCGVVVHPLSLRTAIFLEQAENGFMIPFRFDSDMEQVAHALQVLYFCSPEWSPPESPAYSAWRTFKEGYRAQRFQRRALRAAGDLDSLIDGVQDWINNSCMDCQSVGSSSGVPKQSYASHPAHLVDLFGAAGLTFTYDQIMDMPLKRLWQHWRLAAHRVYEAKLSNPSDTLATDHIAKGKAA